MHRNCRKFTVYKCVKGKKIELGTHSRVSTLEYFRINYLQMFVMRNRCYELHFEISYYKK